MEKKAYQPLEDLIDDSGLKLNYIADVLDISRQRLYEIRTNPSSMGIDQMEILADLLNVDFMTIHKIYKNFKMEVDKNATKQKQEV